MSTDRDDAQARRYRDASAALDERPSAATRAAILAAAARQVEARPRSADAPRVVRRPRWPLAAAAVVLLSTLAVMMADRTGQEMPSFTAPAEQAPAAVAVAPTTAPIAKRSKTTNAREERSSIAAAPTERVDAQRSDAAALARSAPAAAAAGATPAPESAAEKPEATSADRASARERAPESQGVARLDAARDFEGSAPMWLERIVKLRREGREAEADAELKRFRERYPDVQVSPAALPGGAAGTR